MAVSSQRLIFSADPPCDTIKVDITTPALELVDAVCVYWFTFEFAVRLYFWPGKRRTFMKSYMNCFDLLSILPYWILLCIGAAVTGAAGARIVRLTRVLRMLKLVRTNGLFIFYKNVFFYF